MPDCPIVDTHLHIWDTDQLRYPWLGDVPLLNRPYLIDDYRKACREVTVEKMVFLQAEVDFSLFREEADWVTSIAAEDPRGSKGSWLGRRWRTARPPTRT